MTAPQEPADPRPDAQASPEQTRTPGRTAAPQPKPFPEQTAMAEQEEVNTDPLTGLQARLEEALTQIADEKEATLRARAECENIRRRAQEDVSKAHKFGIESFAESMVPVKDSLEAALGQGEQTLNTLREGVESTLKQLSSAFNRNRLTEIDPAQGDKFDPHQHQAISSVPSEQPANTVVQTLQKGYMIADRVLRPALVMVSGGQS